MNTYVLTAIAVLASLIILLVGRNAIKSSKKKPFQKHLLVFFGSGGHTGEMLNLLNALDDKLYSVRSYVAGSDDTMSVSKASLLSNSLPSVKSKIFKVPHARYVKQSWLTTPFTAFWSLLGSISVIFWNPFGIPDVILCNGPGTCVFICLLGYLAKV